MKKWLLLQNIELYHAKATKSTKLEAQPRAKKSQDSNN
jgi:hypothetical protein